MKSFVARAHHKLGRTADFGIIFSAMTLAAPLAHAEGDVQRGARAFRMCLACHSLEPGRHMTGPSLDKLFARHSESLRMAPRLAALVPLAVFLAVGVFLAIGLTLNPREVPSPLIRKSSQ
ncbi:MAG: hypothetical protein A3H97_06535 [Acidobacteria bacterium RIFCSPLOWO2_02_FULL_65_29]|nr:MAG: hypothetical protein A3H97_06535 [Acidobacteria bacterium RIFCSPLOWO2_02_FULL_65_29]